METVFLFVIIFLFILAVFDLMVGVSNDAVNFLNSAIGSKAAPFKRVIIVASIGVFIGAAMSNGMMDIARHGIFRPEYFSFYDLICIFMAVMVTDVILLDVFNTLGMPTSTTVSMVFELLGATFVVAIIKMAGGSELGFSELLNTEKALSVILGIFLSVAIAFFFGTVVQAITRLIFSFNYRSRLKWKIGIFGGLCLTAIVYFLLLKGAKDLVFMTPEVKDWIKSNTLLIVGACLVFFTLLMQLLYILKVNVLKVIVLTGTFSLAMAFAGNDLVNFIGVPLSGLSSFADYSANGAGDAHGYLMGALNGPAQTPIYILIGAGLIMVVALAKSPKARRVTKTEVGLGSQQGGEEMFGSSRLSRGIVRLSIRIVEGTRRLLPQRMMKWIDRRFNPEETIMEQGAAFDLIRGSVNLVLAGALIALGTSLKLPLSTTFVTFMVAMGSSLADRAWGRESAVFRVTGVISVIGGWFITAGAAFICAGIIVMLMHLGGHWVMLALAVVTIVIIVRSNRRSIADAKEENGDLLFQSIVNSDSKENLWPRLMLYITDHQQDYLGFAADAYSKITYAFISDNSGMLGKMRGRLERQKAVMKNLRRKETLCLRSIDRREALEKNTWFHLSNNCCMGIMYNLIRINEVCREHCADNLLPLPEHYHDGYSRVCLRMETLLNDTIALTQDYTPEGARMLRSGCDHLKDSLATLRHDLHQSLREDNPKAMSVIYVYINLLEETQEMVSSVRKYIRAYAKLRDADFNSRSMPVPAMAEA